MGLQMRGQTGEVRRGYRVAARLGPWSLDSKGRIDSVSITDKVDMLLDVGQLDVRLVVGTRTWRWKNVQVLECGDKFSALVEGSPETL